MGQYGLLGSIIGGLVGDGPGWCIGSLVGNEIDRRNDDEELRKRYKRDDEDESEANKLLTINEDQMTQLVKQALEESKTRGPFKNVTFEPVQTGYVVSINFEKL